jgi:hypothetical protein
VKQFFLISCVLSSLTSSFAQGETDVFVASVEFADDQLQISQLRNISNNPGYDNQPSWYDNQSVLYARTRGQATDIAFVSLADPKNTSFPFQQTEGGEYSPQRIGNSSDAMAIRLDPDGYQGMYRYASKGESKELIKGLRMAYFVQPSDNVVIGSVLSGDQLDLVEADLRTGQVDTLIPRSGRSIHLRPGRAAVSYTAESEDNDGMDIFQMDLDSGEHFYIKDLPLGVQDYVWLDSDRILLGSGPRLYLHDLFEGGEWREIANLESYGISDITRMAVSPDGKRLALVATTNSSAESVVQEQLDAYNARDIDAFMATYSEDIALYNFPDQLMGRGKPDMRASYKAFFESAPDLHCEIVNRIVMGNKVIDQESVTANGQTFGAVAIYEVNAGKIIKVTFIR